MMAVDWNKQKAYDEAVEREIARGNFRRALEVLVEGYQHYIVSFCAHMLGEMPQGEEVAQNVFLAAYHAMPVFRQHASVRTWVLAIARKQCFKALRDGQRHRTLEHAQRDVIAAHVHRAPPTSLEHHPEAQLQQVRQSLLRLGQEERALLMMRYDAELSLDHIAEMLDISKASVRRRLARALRHLQEEMGDEGR
jgi:RNA polymerase sigma-70 factor (ECF subfamily)